MTDDGFVVTGSFACKHVVLVVNSDHRGLRAQQLLFSDSMTSSQFNMNLLLNFGIFNYANRFCGHCTIIHQTTQCCIHFFMKPCCAQN